MVADSSDSSDSSSIAISGSSGGSGGSSSGGRVADGYISGARIYIDANDNGIADDGEYTGVMTDANGNFTLTSAPTHALIAVGGTNIDTGLANKVILKAPVGSSVINPLTTLVQTYVQNNGGHCCRCRGSN